VILLVAGLVALVANSRNSPSQDGGLDGQATTAVAGGIEVDATPVTSGDGIRLTELTAESRNAPPLVGDTVTVRYSLTNDGDQDVEVEGTFVGARNEAGDNKDSDEINEGEVLSPGDAVEARGQILLDSPGTWRFWTLLFARGGGECPDEWQVFQVLAVEP
jgi:hypothetical protein